MQRGPSGAARRPMCALALAVWLAPLATLAEEPAPDDLAREIELEIREDRLDERALWLAFYAEWQHAMQDAASASAAIAPVQLACVRSEADLARLRGDQVRYGALAREDFRAAQQGDVKLQIAVAETEVGAHVGLGIVCIGEPRIASLADGSFEVRMPDARYVALLDRERSWWNPRSDEHLAWVLQHEQCHFDLAEGLARRLTARADEIEAATVASGATATQAAQAFSARWKQHLGAVYREFDALESGYDRETAHGTIPEKQTEWLERCKRELAETSSRAR